MFTNLLKIIANYKDFSKEKTNKIRNTRKEVRTILRATYFHLFWRQKANEHKCNS